MATPTPADYVNDPRFSRTFELPADPARGRTKPFKVTYADYGYRNEDHPEQENVLLFFGSLMASRLIHIPKDELAKKYKIRIIDPDRPGVGGTDDVDVKNRMSTWLGTILLTINYEYSIGVHSNQPRIEVIPALLASLHIPHVSVACHSGGTVYALDFVLHHPHLLHPTRPYLAIGGPWILPSRTDSAALGLLQRLPAGVIGTTDKLVSMVNHVAPLFGSSVGVSLALVEKLTPASLLASAADGDGVGGGADRMPEGAKFEADVWPALIKKVYEQSVKGLSGDAVLLLQKVAGVDGWGDWGDYDVLIPRLAGDLRAAGRRLRVDVFYAEKDHMIGDGGSKGPSWFDRCWEEGAGGVIDYQSRTIAGADHDWVWSLKWDAVREAFGKIGVLEEGDAPEASEQMPASR